MHTYFNCGKAKERVMLRVRELDKEMSGEDRFHLENISFHLPKGYICGLVGENGAGKTTLLRCLMGLYSYRTCI